MSTNDITGARLVSRVNDKNYEDNYDRIFSKKDQIEKLKDIEAHCLEPLVNKMYEFCIKYEEAENVSKEIRSLIKDNEKVEND